jgi:hypothetical protein
MTQRKNARCLYGPGMQFLKWGTAVGVLVFVILFPTMARAQGTTSQVNGTVTDGTGAIVIGASIDISNVDTGLAYHAVSNNLGVYHIPDLPPGNYTMDVTKSGFATQHIQTFKLVVGQLLEQNTALAVGQAVQTVSVNSAALLLDTE